MGRTMDVEIKVVWKLVVSRLMAGVALDRLFTAGEADIFKAKARPRVKLVSILVIKNPLCRGYRLLGIRIYQDWNFVKFASWFTT